MMSKAARPISAVTPSSSAKKASGSGGAASSPYRAAHNNKSGISSSSKTQGVTNQQPAAAAASSSSLAASNSNNGNTNAAATALFTSEAAAAGGGSGEYAFDRSPSGRQSPSLPPLAGGGSSPTPMPSGGAMSPQTYNNNNTNPNNSNNLPRSLTNPTTTYANHSMASNTNNNNSNSNKPSFVDLIRAREQQQMRIRMALEEQNQALQNRLRSASEEAREATVNISDFIEFVSEIRDLVMKGNDAEVMAFRALNDEIERQENHFEAKFSALEARVVATERTRDLLREEQTDQLLTLSSEVTSLKDTTVRIEAQIASHTDANEETVVFSEKVSAALQDIEERVVAVEALPSTVRQTLVEMEMRLNQVQLDAQEDLRKIRERYPDTEDKLTLVMTRAEENLLLLQQHADAAVMAAEQQQARIEELIDDGIATLGMGLEGMLTSKYTEHAAHLSADHEALAQRAAAQEEAVADLIGTVKTQVDEYLANLEAKQAESVADALTELQRRAEAFEEERMKSYPVAEPARVEMMLKELEGAFVAIEGVVRNNMLGGMNIDHPYIQRLEALEESVAHLAAIPANDVDKGPKIVFSTDTQTVIDPSSGGASSPSARYRKLLSQEEVLVGTEQSADEIAQTVDLIVERSKNSRSNTPRRAGGGGNVATPSTSAAPTPRDHVANNSLYNTTTHNNNGSANPYMASAYSFSGSNSMGSPQQQAMNINTNTNNSAAGIDRFTLGEELARKEGGVERIQAALKEIAIKFKEISDRELLIEKQMSPQQGAATAALLAKQKGAIYEKERQLLEKRNALLREIAELKTTLRQ